METGARTGHRRRYPCEIVRVFLIYSDKSRTLPGWECPRNNY